MRNCVRFVWKETAVGGRDWFVKTVLIDGLKVEPLGQRNVRVVIVQMYNPYVSNAAVAIFLGKYGKVDKPGKARLEVWDWRVREAGAQGRRGIGWSAEEQQSRVKKPSGKSLGSGGQGVTEEQPKLANSSTQIYSFK
uniref:(Atlantic silverside) hypothetical protein n=1 Tax=Menidia menidia TaxID=238744 RepID=A0A8S4BXL6_9TELE|nr:unnamed protein product [Menidia menidia]